MKNQAFWKPVSDTGPSTGNFMATLPNLVALPFADCLDVRAVGVSEPVMLEHIFDADACGLLSRIADAARAEAQAAVLVRRGHA